MMKNLPHSIYNWVSLTGAMVAAVCFFMIVFLFVVSAIFLQGGSYLGIVIYILLPVVLVAGLLLIPIGMIRSIRREKKSENIKSVGWPAIDLNDIRHRNAFFVFSIGTTIFLFLSAIGSYEAFHFTESVTFCGTLCHSVMNPEYTAYQHSAHAKVACVDCHVGSGADWYVRSKLSGLYQIYSVMFNKYKKPIAVPIHNLRPAREVCEDCHWPQKFYAQKLQSRRHYLNDKENTQWDIQLTIKIGAEQSAHGLKEGIHWHINPDISVEYISEVEKRSNIPWVRYTNHKTGKTVVFMDEENPIDESEIKEENIRKMDCMDCHNRPSHNYLPPAVFVNEAITAGKIPLDLPEIKNLSMEICNKKISNSDSTGIYIQQLIEEFYESDYPEIFENGKSRIQKAVTGLKEVYFANIFPEMNVRWDAYPSHIGHLEFDGCFRCHNNRHVSENEDRIKKDCNLCHIINAQGTPDDMEISQFGEALEFKHPGDVEEVEWQESLCTECHTGLNP